VAFSHDGKQIVSGSGDGTVRLWDSATGEDIGKPLRGHNDQVRTVAFSPDGKQIISGSDDSTVRLWDSVTGRAIGQPLSGHTDEVRSFAFSGDGKQIILGSRDSAVWLWNTVTGVAVAIEDEMEAREPHVLRSTGWVIGPKEKLLWWLPPDHRGKSLWAHGQLAVANSSGTFSIINPHGLLHAIYNISNSD
jgi:WD40 repeat protein